MVSLCFSQVTKQVEERVSFIAAVLHILMSIRAEKYDFTQTYEFSYHSFAMAKPNQVPQWQNLYYPLAYQVWLSTLGSLLLVPITYIAVKYLNVVKETFSRKNSFHTTSYNLYPIFSRLLFSYSLHLMN